MSQRHQFYCSRAEFKERCSPHIGNAYNLQIVICQLKSSQYFNVPIMHEEECNNTVYTWEVRTWTHGLDRDLEKLYLNARRLFEQEHEKKRIACCYQWNCISSDVQAISPPSNICTLWHVDDKLCAKQALLPQYTRKTISVG